LINQALADWYLQLHCCVSIIACPAPCVKYDAIENPYKSSTLGVKPLIYKGFLIKDKIA
jgi:hypothetical protein